MSTVPKEKRHELKMTLEELKEAQDEVDNELSSDGLYYVQSRLETAMERLSRFDHDDLLTAEEDIRQVSSNVVSRRMSDDDIEYVEGEILEARLLIEDVLEQWERKASESS